MSLVLFSSLIFGLTKAAPSLVQLSSTNNDSVLDSNGEQADESSLCLPISTWSLCLFDAMCCSGYCKYGFPAPRCAQPRIRDTNITDSDYNDSDSADQDIFDDLNVARMANISPLTPRLINTDEINENGRRPSKRPTKAPKPTKRPIRTRKPTKKPTKTRNPTKAPKPTKKPTKKPIKTPKPTKKPTRTRRPTPRPTPRPTKKTRKPTKRPTPRPTKKTRKPTRKPTKRPTPKPTPSRFGDVCIGQQTFRGFEFLTQNPNQLVVERDLVQCRQWKIRKERNFNCGQFDCFSIRLSGKNGLYLGRMNGGLSFKRNVGPSDIWLIDGAGPINDNLKALKHYKTNRFLCTQDKLGSIESELVFERNGDDSVCHWMLKE